MHSLNRPGSRKRVRLPFLTTLPTPPRHAGRHFSPLFSYSFRRAHFLPNGNHNPGELRESQLAILPTRLDMPCRIDLSRIFQANAVGDLSERAKLRAAEVGARYRRQVQWARRSRVSHPASATCLWPQCNKSRALGQSPQDAKHLLFSINYQAKPNQRLGCLR